MINLFKFPDGELNFLDKQGLCRGLNYFRAVSKLKYLYEKRY